jgi:hypothetical protein
MDRSGTVVQLNPSGEVTLVRFNAHCQMCKLLAVCLQFDNSLDEYDAIQLCISCIQAIYLQLYARDKR